MLAYTAQMGRQPSGVPSDPWLARHHLERAWHRHAEQGVASDVRDDVASSWERSRAVVPRSRDLAPLADEDRTREEWASSPLRPAVDSLEPDLRSVAEDGYFIVAVTGADGKILWTHGDRWMRDRAEQVNFVPGGRWDEASMGTNALALALSENRSAQVFSAEHFSAAVHEWVCYSAPITDMATGAPLGVLDLSTTWDRAHPLALSTATSLARTLGLLIPQHPTPAGAGLEVRVLGTAHVAIDGRVTTLPPRQVELLAILAMHPDGLGLDALHSCLYEDLSVSLGTCKAEVSHLRRALGGRLGSRPYRLDLPVVADHVEVLRRLTDRDLAGAVEAYGGPLLPASEAPALVEHRHHLDQALREAVLARRDPDLLFALGSRMPDDIALHEAAVGVLGHDDPRRAVARARLDTARRLPGGDPARPLPTMSQPWR